MNDPEATMNNALPKNNLIATERAMTWRLLHPKPLVDTRNTAHRECGV